MKLGHLSQPSQDDDINIAPLIDIVFILLIFFVVTTTFAKDLGLKIERPKASTGAVQPQRIVRVAVSSRGELTVNAKPTSPWRIEGAVREALLSHQHKRALIVADTGVAAGQLVKLVDACKRAGAQSVAVAVDGQHDDTTGQGQTR